MRAKKGLPDISMATVYNCLDALVKCRLVREVNLDRTARRYGATATRYRTLPTAVSATSSRHRWPPVRSDRSSETYA